MATASTLERTADYFKELCVLLTGAHRELIDEVDEEMLDELKGKRGGLDRHVESIKSGAQKLDWSSETEKQSYLKEVERHHQTLDEGLQQMSTDKPLPEAEKDRMYEAADELEACAYGILEDPAIN